MIPATGVVETSKRTERKAQRSEELIKEAKDVSTRRPSHHSKTGNVKRNAGSTREIGAEGEWTILDN